MSIALAGLNDRESVVALWSSAGLTRPWNNPLSDFDLALAAATSTILIARAGTALVGSVMVGFDGHRGWVYYLATDPQRRAKGIGRELMAEAEARLEERGCPKTQLMVRVDNEAALGFYEALGYAVQDVVTVGRRLEAP